MNSRQPRSDSMRDAAHMLRSKSPSGPVGISRSRRMRAVPVNSDLNSTVGQLWAPLICTDAYRVVLNGHNDSLWTNEKTFSIIPSERSPRLLVTADRDRNVVANALVAYDGIRDRKARWGRTALSTAMRLNLSLGRDALVLQRLRGSQTQLVEPIAHMETILGEGATVLIGVRTGANGKATLQMFDSRGAATGYAKLAWNELTTTFVNTEIQAVQALAEEDHDFLVPGLLAHGMLGEMPYLMSRPLPPNVRSVPARHELTISELADVAPLDRITPVSESAQFASLVGRAEALRHSPETRAHVGALNDLLSRLSQQDSPLPIGRRWHGDLVPWNVARQPDGSLWIWDWETSEQDTAVGMDVLHWHTTLLSHADPGATASGVKQAGQASREVLRALGLGHRQSMIVTALYCATMVERNLRFVVQHGGWQLNRLPRPVIAELLMLGGYLLDAAEQEPGPKARTQ